MFPRGKGKLNEEKVLSDKAEPFRFFVKYLNPSHATATKLAQNFLLKEMFHFVLCFNLFHLYLQQILMKHAFHATN